MTRTPPAATGLLLREVEAPVDVPLLVHPGWAEHWPWLIQGTTWRGPSGDFDLGLFGAQPVGRAIDRWRILRRACHAAGIVHARQVHGTSIRIHDSPIRGLNVIDDHDGHHTALNGLVLAVAVADCVPVSIVDPNGRAVTLLHAGWRGIAGGIIEAGIRLAAAAAGDTARLHVHFGPAICGRCYEVGPEVHRRLGFAEPPTALPVDLREIGATRARTAGVPAAAISISSLCTRCADDRPLFSHRAGEAGRQMAVLGLRSN